MMEEIWKDIEGYEVITKQLEDLFLSLNNGK